MHVLAIYIVDLIMQFKLNALHMTEEAFASEWLAYTKITTHMTYDEGKLDYSLPY